MSTRLPNLMRAQVFALLRQRRAIADEAQARHGDAWSTIPTYQRMVIHDAMERCQKPLERQIEQLRAEMNWVRELRTLAVLIKRAQP